MKTPAKTAPATKPRTEVNTRMPIATADLLEEAAERTGQTKTAILVDALHYYCGRIQEDPNIQLRRASVLAAVHGTTTSEVAATQAALAKLAATLSKLKP